MIGSKLFILSKNSEVSLAGVAGIFKLGVRLKSFCLLSLLDVGKLFEDEIFVEGEFSGELSNSLYSYRVLLL